MLLQKHRTQVRRALGSDPTKTNPLYELEKALLLATELSVKEVGARVGYREPSQFTKTFKQVHSSTPSSFRSRRPGVNRPTLT